MTKIIQYSLQMRHLFLLHTLLWKMGESESINAFYNFIDDKNTFF